MTGSKAWNWIEETSKIWLTPSENGEIYLTLCLEDTWSFKDAGYPKVDENTIIKTEKGPEGIPHFYVTLHDILKLFKDFKIERIRHIDDCYFEGK